MNPVGWIVAASAMAGLVLVLLPERRPVPTLLALRAARARQAVRETRPGTVIAPAGAAAIGGVVAIRWGPALGMAAVMTYGVCVWALSIRARSALRTTRTERVARLTVVLANQATTATTSGEALTRAAPLVRGSVGSATERLAAGYQQGAVADAAREFVETVPVTASVWLTDILAAAGRGSGRVSEVLSALEDLAAAEADAARHFHRKVAAQMLPLAVALLLSVGTVVGMAVWMPSFGEWLVSPGGQLVTLGAAAGSAAVCAPVFASAAAAVKA